MLVKYLGARKEHSVLVIRERMREPKTCLGRVFNYKVGSYDDVHILIYVDACPHLYMDKLKLTGQNLGRVFKFRLGHVCIGHKLYTFCKTAQLKVENLAQTTFRFSPGLECNYYMWLRSLLVKY